MAVEELAFWLQLPEHPDAAAKEALTNVAMQIAAMNPQYIAKEDISAEELAKTKEITIDSALNDPASLPKPILNSLFAKAVEGNVFSAEDVTAYEEQKNNKYLFNFLSEAAKKSLADLALADKAAIVENKIFNGLVERTYLQAAQRDQPFLSSRM